MAAAGEIVAGCLGDAARDVPPGRDDRRARPRGGKFIRAQGGEPAFKGYRGFPASICTSPNSMVVHGIPGDYELAARRRPLDRRRRRVRGLGGRCRPDRRAAAVSPVATRLLKATRESLEAATEQAVPGNRLGDVSHAVQERVERDGLSVIRSLVGHGIGRQMHEDPQVPNFGEPGRGPLLEEGMVFCVEPMVCAGRPRRADGGRQLGDLLRGRLAHGPFRAHDRRHRRGPADPHALAPEGGPARRPEGPSAGRAASASIYRSRAARFVLRAARARRPVSWGRQGYLFEESDES